MFAVSILRINLCYIYCMTLYGHVLVIINTTKRERNQANTTKSKTTFYLLIGTCMLFKNTNTGAVTGLTIVVRNPIVNNQRIFELTHCDVPIVKSIDLLTCALSINS